MRSTDAPHVLFDRFRLDLAQKQLFRGEERIGLPPKAMDLLILLVEARGRLVSKDEILDAVWSGVVVEEASIAKVVFLLRRTLGDDEQGQPLIETLPKRGYRLAVEVVKPQGTRLENVIAVLPFTDLSTRRDLAHVAEGLADEVLIALGRSAGLRVVARTSSFALAEQRLDARQIGARLTARAIIEGSVRSLSDSIRVTARLIDCRTGTQLWADAFDRVEDELPEMAGRIASAAAVALGADPPPVRDAPVAPTRTNSRAHDLYLQGRYLWNRRPGEVVWQAIRLFEEAAALDDRFALAWAGLADAHAILGSWESGALPHGDAQRKAREYAARALSLQPELPEAVTTLAYTALHYDWNPEAATAGFRSALQRNPSYGPAQHWLSHSLLAAGRVEESLQASQRALALDPFNPLIRVHLAWHHFMAREPLQVIEQTRQVLHTDPAYAWAHCFLAWGEEAVGETRKSVDAARRAVAHSNGDPVMLVNLARVLASDGERTEALKVAGELRHTDADDRLFSYELALVHLALGEEDVALDRLETAVRQRSGWIAYWNVDPRLDPLRGKARFGSLTSRIEGAPAR
jgi:adenylate cyclase